MKSLGNTAQFRQLCLAFGCEALRDRHAMLTMIFTFAAALIAIAFCDVALAAGGTVTSPSALMPTLGIVEASLPILSLVGCCTVAFVTTAAPLVTYRATGVLQHLSTTPIRSAPLVTAHLVARLPVGAAQITLIAALAVVFPAPSPTALTRFILLLTAGFVFFISLGCLIGARFRTPERTMGFALIATMLVIATSGAAFPFSLFPHPLATVCSWLPTTLFVDALAAELTISSARPAVDSPILTFLLLAAAATVLTIAAASLRWQPGQQQ